METIPPHQDAIEFFDGVVYVIEATSDEYLFLWQEWAQNRKGFTWDEDNRGYMSQIGTLDNRPVMIHVRKARLLGKVVAFWEMTSAVCDLTMADDWLKKVSEAYRDGHEYNVSNFSHCIQYVCSLIGGKPSDYPRIWDHLRKKIVTPLPPRRTGSSQTMKAVTTDLALPGEE